MGSKCVAQISFVCQQENLRNFVYSKANFSLKTIYFHDALPVTSFSKHFNPQKKRAEESALEIWSSVDSVALRTCCEHLFSFSFPRGNAISSYEWREIECVQKCERETRAQIPWVFFPLPLSFSLIQLVRIYSTVTLRLHFREIFPQKSSIASELPRWHKKDDDNFGPANF